MDVAQRLGHQHAVGIVQSRAAVFLGLGQPQQPQIAQPLEHLVGGKDLGGFPFIDVRVDVLVDVALERLADFFVLVGELHRLVS